MWEYAGQQRPPFAEPPRAGQESVWDYPRPPKIEASTQIVEVYDGDTLLARSQASYRVLETASPPTIYLPNSAIDWSQLLPVAGTTVCEWKGLACYWALARDPQGEPVAWGYPEPLAEVEMLRDHTSFYPGRLACYIDAERVQPQPGGYYGGWVTKQIVGPFKGEPGTETW